MIPPPTESAGKNRGKSRPRADGPQGRTRCRFPTVRKRRKPPPALAPAPARASSVQDAAQAQQQRSGHPHVSARRQQGARAAGALWSLLRPAATELPPAGAAASICRRRRSAPPSPRTTAAPHRATELTALPAPLLLHSPARSPPRLWWLWRARRPYARSHPVPVQLLQRPAVR